MKVYTIEKRVNNTIIFCKVSYNCLSEKQKSHLSIKKFKKIKKLRKNMKNMKNMNNN